MNTALKNLGVFIIILTFLTTSFTGCIGDDDDDEKEEQEQEETNYPFDDVREFVTIDCP